MEDTSAVGRGRRRARRCRAEVPDTAAVGWLVFERDGERCYASGFVAANSR
jgi:hypothetical protein